MNLDAVLAAIDQEINKLQQVRAMLSSATAIPERRAVGRPKGAKKATGAKAKKRVLSEEARARIAAAQKKRWAAAKKGSK